MGQGERTYAIACIDTPHTHRDCLEKQDAADFVPQRWLDGRQIGQSKDPFGFQPFSAGPRICIGQQFGKSLVEVLACNPVLSDYIGKSQPDSFS